MQDEIVYSITGLKGMELSDSELFSVNNDYVSAFRISSKLDEIYILTKEGVSFSANEDKIDRIVTNIYMNLIIDGNTELYSPEIMISKINGNKPTSNSSLQMKVSAIVIKGNKNGKYFKLLSEDKNPFETDLKIYDKIKAILSNPSIIVQFVGLYEMMKGNKNQKELIQYLTTKKEEYNIDFFDTKKQNCNYKEDLFTYIRNDISHIERENNLMRYKRLGEDINQSLIKKMIKIIIEMQ